MNAANKVLLMTGVALFGVSASQAAQAQYFSSEGRSGHYGDMFLAGTQKTSIEQNVMATVRVSNNFGEIEIRDFVVNYNSHNAQVLDDRNVKHRIRVKQTPSGAEKFTWELWQAVCRKEFAKISKRPAPSETLKKLPDQVSISFDGSLFSIPVKRLDRKDNCQIWAKRKSMLNGFPYIATPIMAPPIGPTRKLLWGLAGFGRTERRCAC